MKKNGKTIAVILGLALSAALPLAVHAQAATPGIYVGANIGQSEALDYECDLLPGCKKKGTAWKLYSGWQFHRNFAAEIGFTDLGHASSNFPGFFDETVKVRMGELSLVASWPATNRFSLFGRAGAYYAKTADDFVLFGTSTHLAETNSGFTYGGGVQYFVWSNVGLRVEFQKWLKVGGGDIPKSDYQAFTAGLLWKFQ
jgi:OOP family OmpA-OmpF porin